MVMVIILLTLLIEMVIIRPISVFILSLFYLCEKCCCRKSYQFKLDLQDDVNQSIEKSRNDIDLE